MEPPSYRIGSQPIRPQGNQY